MFVYLLEYWMESLSESSWTMTSVSQSGSVFEYLLEYWTVCLKEYWRGYLTLTDIAHSLLDMTHTFLAHCMFHPHNRDLVFHMYNRMNIVLYIA